jgi:uncharacterized OB-fold protein
MSQIDGSKCSCGRVVAPARRYCPDCQRTMAPVKLEAQGKVETHTTIEVTAEGFEPPIHLAVVRVAEGSRGKTPVRVLVRSAAALTTGKAVKLEAQGEVLWAVA